MATSYYSTGTVSLTNGSAVVTGIGTGWQMALIAGGWVTVEAPGNQLPIASVDSDSQITAELDWTGATGVYSYTIQRDTAYLQSLDQNSLNLSYLLSELRAGTIFKYDQSGDLAGRDLYDTRPKNFGYLVTIGVSQPEFYVKASAADGDWAGPFPYGVGPKGDKGDQGDVGPYTSVTVGSVTTLPPGSTATVTPVPVSPTEVALDFAIPRGFDGDGAGDMMAGVYDPQNKLTDAFVSANHGYDGAISGLTAGTVQGAIDELASRPGGTPTPMDFGAVGDGITDDTAALIAMFQSTGTREFDGLGKTYLLSSTVLVQRDDLVVRNLYTTGVIANTTPSIKFLGAQEAAVSLSAAASVGSNTITVADPASFSVDQWIWIRSDTVLWNGIPFGELAKIRTIDAGTGVITLYDRIFLYYNTGDAARVVPLTMRENITLDNCGVRGNVSVTDQIGFEFEFCSNVEIRNPRTWDCEYVHIWFKAVADGRVFGGVGERTGTIKGLNYGIVAGNSCNNILVDGYTGRSMRHVVATGGTTGINRNIRAVNSNAFDSLDAGFDAHPQTAECDFSNNTVHMRNGIAAGADGIICQGADFTAKGNKIYGPTRNGVFYQPNLAFAGVKNKCKLNDNHAESIQGIGTTSGVSVLAGAAGADIASASVVNNTTVGFANGCFIGATGANITDVTINAHIGEENSARGIQMQVTTGRSIVRGSISGCGISQLAGAFEAINLTSADANGILNFAISGNSTQGGTYGIRGANTQYIATTGNVTRGASVTAVQVAGANSVATGNVA